MDDLNEKLTGLLSSPEGMAKIQGLMAALGGGEAALPPVSAPPASPAPPPAVSTPASAAMEGGLPDMGALMKLMPLLSGMGQDTPDTRLLLALRPYLHGEREKRLEETMGLLRLMRLLPLLQEKAPPGGMQNDG